MDSSRGTRNENDSDVEEVLMYRCRECPGKTFTADERDSHRAWHKMLKRQKKAADTTVRQTRSQQRKLPGASSSTEESEVTIFEPLDQEQLTLHSVKKRRTDNDEAEDSPPSGKRKSRKWYNKSLTGNWVKGLSG